MIGLTSFRRWLNRRARIGVAGLVTLALALVVTACGGSGSSSGGSSSEGGSTSPSAGQETTTFGKAAGPVDNINWALPYGEPPTLDPPNTAFYSSAFTVAQLCDTLLRYKPDLTTEPGLAEVTQPDPKTIQIQLKKGIKFWDGTEMTSDDVKYSLERTADPENITGFLFESVKSIDATDKYHVTIHLSKADELPIKELASFAGMVYEKKYAEGKGKSFGTSSGGIMCSGPFELAKWNPGKDIELKANPSYWDPKYKPHAKTVDLQFFSETSALTNALVSGEAEGAYEVPPQAIPRLEGAGTGELHFGPALLYYNFSAMRPEGPLTDHKVWEALERTIDRKALAEVVFHGAAEPNYTLLAKNTFDPEAEALWEAAYKPYEEAGEKFGSSEALEEAKKLVEESEYNGEPIVFIVQAGDITGRDVAQLIQQQADQIGLKVTIKTLPAIQYAEAVSNPEARQGADLSASLSFNVAKDPLEPIPFNVLPGSFYNYTEYENPQVTKLLETAKETLDPKKRNELTIKAQSIYEKEVPATTLLDQDEISFLNKKLSGMTTSFAYMNTPSLALIGAAPGE